MSASATLRKIWSALARAVYKLPYSGQTDFGGLSALFRRFGRAERAVVILTVPGTDQFVQFSGGRNGIQLNLPLVTRDQLDREAAIRAFVAERGERVIESRGTNGARFLDVELPADPDRLALLTAGVFSEAFGAPQTVKLTIQTDRPLPA
jgi:hypothetical protein